VKLFDGLGREVRRSVNASQVNLELTPLVEKIELKWGADVPWTNNSQDFPMHYIYRDRVVDGDTAQMVLYDSVNVNLNGFVYMDDRQPLSDKIKYSYYVQALGTYGNPAIAAPQINLSQIVGAKPNDTIPPTSPELNIEAIDCEAFLADKDCDFSSFFNILTWNGIKEDDVRGYNIYFSESGDEETFELIDFVKNDTFYVHTDINSFKGCYYITTVDRSDNESVASGTVCNDNCPYYKLPNVITPNGDGTNDTFRPLDENSADTNAQCPRFVESVYFRVFNRWGNLLYEYKSGGENSIYINWDGRDSQGLMLASGNYYYSAEVVFDVRREEDRQQTLRGWVQLLY
jgi:gliding motility-associated-like protein